MHVSKRLQLNYALVKSVTNFVQFDVICVATLKRFKQTTFDALKNIAVTWILSQDHLTSCKRIHSFLKVYTYQQT